MIDHSKVRQALRAKLMVMPGMLPDTQVAPENRPFTPPNVPAGNPPKDVKALLWLEELFIPTLQAQVASATDQFSGYVQYNVYFPSGMGTEAPEQLAAKITNHFRPPKTIKGAKGLPSVKVYRAERGTGADAATSSQNGGVWYRIPVYVYFRVFDVQPIEPD